MFDEVGTWFESSSYAGIFIGIVLTGLGLPVPEEAFVLFAGMASAHGVMKDPWLALAACFTGALVGDTLTYSLGRRFGYSLLREHPVISKHLTAERERRIEQLIKRHGFKVFLVSRFLVGVRSPVYLTAGILRVPFVWFLCCDAISAAMVVGSFFGLSYFFADQIQNWWEWIRQAELALTLGVLLGIVGVGIFVYRKYKHRLHADPAAFLDQALGCSSTNESNGEATPGEDLSGPGREPKNKSKTMAL